MLTTNPVYRSIATTFLRRLANPSSPGGHAWLVAKTAAFGGAVGTAIGLFADPDPEDRGRSAIKGALVGASIFGIMQIVNIAIEPEGSAFDPLVGACDATWGSVAIRAIGATISGMIFGAIVGVAIGEPGERGRSSWRGAVAGGVINGMLRASGDIVPKLAPGPECAGQV